MNFMCAYQPLLGFRDFYPQDQRVLNYLFEIVRKTALNFGFEEYSSPVLEPIELLTAKSGDEIVNQLFNFVDKGGRYVALRPEMTPAVARMIGEKFSAMRKPIKWFNIAENFRYERPQKGRLRSFYQFNIDIFGEIGCHADAEVILLTIMIMQNFGLNDFFVRLSDRQLWVAFLKAINVADASVMAVLSIIDKSEREKSDKTIEALRKICPQNFNLFDQILELKSVHSIGELQSFLERYDLLKSSEIKERIDILTELISILSDAGVFEYISLDFGVVRGLAYYTGFVFEIFDRELSSRALAGGGRYDSLTEKLGYQSIPAVGLAIGDVTLSNLLHEKRLLPQCKKSLDYFFVFEPFCQNVVLKVANMLRRNNISVEYCLNNISFSRQFKTASQSGAAFALICGEQEMTENVFKLKNLSTGDETFVDQDNVLNYIKSNFNKND